MRLQQKICDYKKMSVLCSQRKRMKKCIIFIYCFLTVALGVATFLEAIYGTATITTMVYNSLWFFVLWTILGMLGGVYLLRRKMWNRPAALLLHIAFIVILLGAGITWIFSEKGMIHIREGEQENKVQITNGMGIFELPFSVKLNTFSIVYYEGTKAPSDYTSNIAILEENSPVLEQTIAMNEIVSYKGYRFYQSSFDEDGKGTWLSVNHDPWGIGVTYAGYILLLFAMIFVLCSKSCGFRKLLQHPLLRNGFLLLLLIPCMSQRTYSQETKMVKPLWEKVYADSAATRQVIYNNRIAPFNTLARDFTIKLYGKPSYKGLSAEQVVGSWLLFPDVWKKEPMILVKSAELRDTLGLQDKYARYVDFFDKNGNYRLQKLWATCQQTTKRGEPPSSLQKAIMQVDEKIALVTLLQQKQLIRTLPDDGSIEPLSDTKIMAEIWYNRIPFTKILFMLNLTLGFLAIIILCINILRNGTLSHTNIYSSIFSFLLFISFAFHSIGMCLLGYITGRIPLSNGYETMMFVAWCILLLACILRKRFPITVPFGLLLSGFALLVAWLGQKNPQITQLMPVLHSPLLSLHVSVIMISYALFAFVTLNGILGIVIHCIDKDIHAKSIESLAILSKAMLYPAVFLLGIGIFLGAVWANVSWGNYWSWDPKETWALITFLAYSATFHTESVSKFNKPLFFHIYVCLAFLTVLMTYFGVNNLLGGMHSYK